MKRPRTPQEKKALSLENDRRNVVAESQWGARDAITKRKQWVNQSYRKVVHQELSALPAAHLRTQRQLSLLWLQQSATIGASNRMFRSKWLLSCVAPASLGAPAMSPNNSVRSFPSTPSA